MIDISNENGKIRVDGLFKPFIYEPSRLEYEVDGDFFRLIYDGSKVLGRLYNLYNIGSSMAALVAHFESVKASALLDVPSLSYKFYDFFKGRVYIRKGRWYGLNPSYGESYYNMNYVQSRGDFDEPPSSLTYDKGVGSTPIKNSKLKGICINITRVSADIDNLQVFVNKMSKSNNSAVVTNKTLLHQAQKADGLLVQSSKAYFIELPFDEPVTVNDVIQIFFNSSSSSNSTRYLYGTDIKFIYE